MNRNDKNLTWLNRGGRWRGHHWAGLEIGVSGALELLPLPLGNPADSNLLSGLPVPDGPAGVAMDALGGIYISDPTNNRVLIIDGCDGAQRTIPCFGGHGKGPGRLDKPRGLIWSRARQALLVVDSGNDRIQVFDPARGQVLEIWSSAGTAAGQFETPWTIAADSSGAFYVTDYGNRRVQKLDSFGEPTPSFWQNVYTANLLKQPSDVAASEVNGEIRIYIVDAAVHTVFVFNADGSPVLDSFSNPVRFGAEQLQQPMGIAAIGESVLVGDNARQQVLSFNAALGYRFAGTAVDYRGPVAALAAGSTGQLLVLPAGGAGPIVLQLDKGYSSQGVFWTDAISTPAGKVTWHRLETVCGDLSTDAHLQLFFFTSDKLTDTPTPPQLQMAGTNPFTDSKWRPRPSDVTDVYLGGAPASYIWCGAWFSGDGLGTPSVSQMRIEFDHETYAADLPAIYRKPGECVKAHRDFLLRMLSLFETFNLAEEDAIRNLPALFDPQAAPADYLNWLAEWLAVDLEEDWDEATTRRTLEGAFASYGRRGTPAGLKLALKEYAGVDAVIEEPLLNAAWWVLPAPTPSPCGAADPGVPVTWVGGENSMLGFTTMLAPAEPQGAVAGTSAVLDQSHLMDDTSLGVPLFEDVAFQFSVLVYRGQVNCPATLALVQSVIDREKPAHTTAQLCILEPNMRVGFQARVGIDTIVAGPPASMRLGDTPGLGMETALGGQPAGRIGVQSRLGMNTLVG